MASDARVNYTNIDYNLEPEPDGKKSLQENGCKEWLEWLQARRDELKAMQDFGVYRVVDRKGNWKEMLTSKWVHKRKTNKFEKCRVTKQDWSLADLLSSLTIALTQKRYSHM